METYHLDTSVVMRLLVQDPPAQYIRAAEFLEAELLNEAAVFVCDLSLARPTSPFKTSTDCQRQRLSNCSQDSPGRPASPCPTTP